MKTYFAERVATMYIEACVCENCRSHNGCTVRKNCTQNDFAHFRSRDHSPVDAAARMIETVVPYTTKK